MEGADFVAPPLRLQTTCPAPGPRALLVFRPEDALPAEAYPGNRLDGMVIACMFLGRCWRVTLQCGSHSFQLDWPHRVVAAAPLAFSIAPDRCALVAPDPGRTH